MCFKSGLVLPKETWLPSTLFTLWPPAAFHQSTLLGDRWLLGAVAPKADGVWHDILTVDDGKQHVFMQRILFMHNINKGKAGKAQSLRIPQTVWDLEVDLACLAGHVLDAMSSYRNPENLLVFDEAVIKAAMTNFIEGTL